MSCFVAAFNLVHIYSMSLCNDDQTDLAALAGAGGLSWRFAL